MKIKQGFILREVAGSFIVVAVGNAVKEFNGIINLNKTGAFLWKQIEKGGDEDSLTKALLSEYGIEESVARADAKEFIKKLTEAGLVK